MCFSPDGSRIASASADGTVKVWDAHAGQELLPLKGHTRPVLSVCFSPDGSRIASASQDWTLKVWDVQTGQELRTLHEHTADVTSVCFSPDGTRIASASEDTTVKVWEGRRTRADMELRQRFWQRQQAEECETQRNWFAAASHLSQMLRTEKDNAALLRRRGRAYAEQGRWPQAVADFRAASQAQPNDASARRDLGLALLASGDEPGYRQVCAKMLRDFGETQDAETTKAVVSLTVLLPGAVPEPKALLPLGHKAVAGQAADARALALLGAALYRAGAFDEALAQLERARDVAGEGKSIEAELFLAMVQQRLRHNGRGRTSLAEAVEHLDSALKPPEKDAEARSPSWDERLRWQRLRQEAEKLLQETNP